MYNSHAISTYYVCITFGLIIFMTQCKNDDTLYNIDDRIKIVLEDYSPDGQFSYYIMPRSDDFASLPNQDPHNPITQEKIALGQMLFFDPAIAQIPKNYSCYESYSCSSCHIPEKGFLPGRMQGIADGAIGFGHLGSTRSIVPGYAEEDLDAQGNRPLTVMNVTYMTNTLWSGLFGANDKNIGTESAWKGLAEVNKTGYYGLEAQNIEGFDLHRLAINEKVLHEYGYAYLFDRAFPDFPKENRYTPETASFAMGAYLRSILTNEAPFQKYLRGNMSALSENQKKGAIIFLEKAGCIKCHNSPSFGSMNFFALGTKDMYEIGGLNTSVNDPRIKGRAMFTGKEEDAYTFKVPQLYNLKDYVTYFHGSSKNSIAEVVDFKLAAQSENPLVPQSKVAITPKHLTEEEKSQLIDFLTHALYDPNMIRYKPSHVPSGMCFPNNDTQSRLDMDCQ